MTRARFSIYPALARSRGCPPAPPPHPAPARASRALPPRSYGSLHCAVIPLTLHSFATAEQPNSQTAKIPYGSSVIKH